MWKYLKYYLLGYLIGMLAGGVDLPLALVPITVGTLAYMAFRIGED